MDSIVARRLLGERMSDISERCWYAGWMLGTEYTLWQAVVEGPMAWGHDVITEEDIAVLKALADQADGWIMFDDIGPQDELFIPKEEWQRVYAIWASKNAAGK